MLYLLLCGLESFLGYSFTKLQAQQLRGSKQAAIRTFFLTFLMLVVSFTEFGLLTRIYPFKLVLILIGALALGNFLYFVTGAITGFTLAEKQEKMRALSVIWGISKPVAGVEAAMLSLAGRLATIIGALWVFWTHPIGDPGAVVLIALFQFVLWQAVVICASILMQWPIVTSEYLDDDIRNSYLAQSFSRIVYSTIYLLFPLWLFKQDIEIAYPNLMPADLARFWILLSVPIFLFLAGGVLPFFLGVSRYRAQVKVMFDWLEQWLKQVLITNTLPVGELRTRQVQDAQKDLQDEIDRRISHNELLQFYHNVTGGPTQDASAVPAVATAPDLETPQSDTSGPAVPTPVLAEQARSILTWISGKAGKAESQTSSADVAAYMVRDNQKNLVYWDFRFYYLKRLLELAEAMPQVETRDMKTFLDATLHEIEQRPSNASVRSNVLAGTFLTVISSLGVWVFKNFQNQILGYVRQLVK